MSLSECTSADGACTGSALSASQEDALSDLPLTISEFPTAFPKGPAFGIMKRTTWGEFSRRFGVRRQGKKDGPNFIPATFKTEPNGQVQRLKKNVLTRTAVALDCETNKATREIPPPPKIAVDLIERQGWAAVVYTSHNHTEAARRSPTRSSKTHWKRL